jgi:H+/Cl- antiporter ClcA/CBS domain-containing protein
MTADQPIFFWQKLLAKLTASSNGITLLLAMGIGGATGSGVLGFRWSIDRIHDLFFENLDDWVGGSRWLWTILIPLVGGLIVGAMRWYWQDFGPNVSSMLDATRSGRLMQPARGIVKTIAAAVSLGTGASLGPEGPSVEIGANFGVLMAQALRVSQERQRLLLGAGAAAGVAAGFNSPIAGVFFALEVVLDNTTSSASVSVVVLSAVLSSLLAQIGLGSQPAFKLPTYEVRSAAELPLYIGLGLLTSILSYSSMQLIQWSRDFFKGKISGLERVGQIPNWLSPSIGGLAVGLVALRFPQILGIGYETIEAMLQDVGFSLLLVMSLVLVKMIVTAISLGSGLVGGIFAPSMFLGACMGTAYAKSLLLLFPALDGAIADPPAYAMVGMATMLASNARAPLTAILLMFELTRDYRIVLPLMACVGLSIWLVDRLQGNNKGNPSGSLERIGLSIQSNERTVMLEKLLVREVMQKNWLTLPTHMNLLTAVQQLVDRELRSAIVIEDSGAAFGVVTLDDLNRALSSGTDSSQRSIDAICTKPILYAYGEETVATAMGRMSGRDLHQLPVVERDQPGEILGLFCRSSIDNACILAIARNHLAEHRFSEVQKTIQPEAG